MEKIRCPNCGAILFYDQMYDTLYIDSYCTECCTYYCPECKKEYQVDFHYKYEDYSIEEAEN